MYLSKITVLPTAQAATMLVRLGSNGSYGSHQLLWQLFTEQKERDFLYREEAQPGGRPIFWVQSQSEPEKHPLFSVQTKVFAPQLGVGQRLAFKLRVNPTISVKAEAGRGKRHDVMMHAKRTAKASGAKPEAIKAHMNQAMLQWFSEEKRLQNWGIKLDCQPDIISYTQHQSRKNSGQAIRFSSVDLQGLITLTEPDRFLTQMGRGFGRAKSMGCGLMMIRPA